MVFYGVCFVSTMNAMQIKSINILQGVWYVNLAILSERKD